MSDVPRETREFRREADTFCAEDACYYARDILWKSGTEVNNPSTSLQWRTNGNTYTLFVDDFDTPCPEYTFSVDDQALGMWKTFSFSIDQRFLSVKYIGIDDEPKQTNHADEIKDLVYYLSTNKWSVEIPDTDYAGNRRFEAMAAHYALVEANGGDPFKNWGAIKLMSDQIQREKKIEDVLERALMMGIVVPDGEGSAKIPFTKSKGMARLVLDDLMRVGAKQLRDK